MRRLRKKALTFAQRLAHQPNFAQLKIAQPAVNDPRRSAGSAGGEIMLLHQQRPAATLRTLARNGHAIDAAADDKDLEGLVAKSQEQVLTSTLFLDAFSGYHNIT